MKTLRTRVAELGQRRLNFAGYTRNDRTGHLREDMTVPGCGSRRIQNDDWLTHFLMFAAI